jgi:hypothetical protein
VRINLSKKAERTNFKFKMCILRWYVKAEKNDIRIIKRGGARSEKGNEKFSLGLC